MMNYKLSIILFYESILLILAHKYVFSNPGTFFNALSHREKRYVTYPTGTAIGLLVAIALPVDVPEENLYFSLNFEANYNLPDNITQYYNSDIARMLNSITRSTTYRLIESYIERQGYDGEECLLRFICETAQYNFPAHGLLESIFSIIFKPSSSFDDDLPEKYGRAETMGMNSSRCDEIFSKCHWSLIHLFSI